MRHRCYNHAESRGCAKLFQRLDRNRGRHNGKFPDGDMVAVGQTNVDFFAEINNDDVSYTTYRVNGPGVCLDSNDALDSGGRSHTFISVAHSLAGNSAADPTAAPVINDKGPIIHSHSSAPGRTGDLWQPAWADGAAHGRCSTARTAS